MDERASEEGKAARWEERKATAKGNARGGGSGGGRARRRKRWRRRRELRLDCVPASSPGGELVAIYQTEFCLLLCANGPLLTLPSANSLTYAGTYGTVPYDPSV